MTAIALALFTLFIAYVMIWSIKNDHVRSIGEQSGLIKMRDPQRSTRKAKGAAPNPPETSTRSAAHRSH